MSIAINRRKFINATAHGLAGAVFAGCASSPRVGHKHNAIPVIDTHTHFYDPTRAEGVPWPPNSDNLLYRRVLPKHYRALRTVRPVTGTVVVEASPWVEDNQWVLALGTWDAFIVGFVGNLPVGTNAFAGHLKRFAANEIFRGIRVGARNADDAGCLMLEEVATAIAVAESGFRRFGDSIDFTTHTEGLEWDEAAPPSVPGIFRREPPPPH